MKIDRTMICAAFVGLGLIVNSVATAEAGTLKLKTKETPKTATIGKLTTGFAMQCANGFSLAGSKKNNGWVDWYVCSTPVIQCPKQLQSNGKYSSVKPKVVIQQIGGDPDAPEAKFRVQYQCDYQAVPIPIP